MNIERSTKNIAPTLFLTFAIAISGLTAGCESNEYVKWSGKYCPDGPCKTNSNPKDFYGVIIPGKPASCPPTINKVNFVNLGNIVYEMEVVYYLSPGSCKFTPLPKPIPQQH